MSASYLLVVDDDPQITTLLRIVLGRVGWHVRESHSGTQALDMARQRRPDAVLVDLWMPDMTGADVVQEMVTEPGLAEVPVIVTTGDTEAPEVSGAFATLTKPFSVEQLYHTIRAAIGAGDRSN